MATKAYLILSASEASSRRAHGDRSNSAIVGRRIIENAGACDLWI
jgi:hypothetical protein